jgi:hypothetical protein
MTPHENRLGGDAMKKVIFGFALVLSLFAALVFRIDQTHSTQIADGNPPLPCVSSGVQVADGNPPLPCGPTA